MLTRKYFPPANDREGRAAVAQEEWPRADRDDRSAAP